MYGCRVPGRVTVASTPGTFRTRKESLVHTVCVCAKILRNLGNFKRVAIPLARVLAIAVLLVATLCLVIDYLSYWTERESRCTAREHTKIPRSSRNFSACADSVYQALFPRAKGAWGRG